MIPDSDHLSQGVLRPVLGKALRGDKQGMYTPNESARAVTTVTLTVLLGVENQLY
jgi:hypothetical protein